MWSRPLRGGGSGLDRDASATPRGPGFGARAGTGSGVRPSWLAAGGPCFGELLRRRGGGRDEAPYGRGCGSRVVGREVGRYVARGPHMRGRHRAGGSVAGSPGLAVRGGHPQQEFPPRLGHQPVAYVSLWLGAGGGCSWWPRGGAWGSRWWWWRWPSRGQAAPKPTHGHSCHWGEWPQPGFVLEPQTDRQPHTVDRDPVTLQLEVSFSPDRSVRRLLGAGSQKRTGLGPDGRPRPSGPRAEHAANPGRPGTSLRRGAPHGDPGAERPPLPTGRCPRKAAEDPPRPARVSCRLWGP